MSTEFEEISLKYFKHSFVSSNVPIIQDGVCETKLLLNEEPNANDQDMQQEVSTYCDVQLNAKCEDLSEENFSILNNNEYGNEFGGGISNEKVHKVSNEVDEQMTLGLHTKTIELEVEKFCFSGFDVPKTSLEEFKYKEEMQNGPQLADISIRRQVAKDVLQKCKSGFVNFTLEDKGYLAEGIVIGLEIR
ncbi:hypothetical protein SLEP1_g13305 [Rubroshorea leprosula]|uniref:Uncharacterized protein n=1 Tax=Rubroshorea leprosula TaxID=152421 RepID=A0AAV5ILD6_9ROSI|nr:hypothetical protein SLEP1_g13305 [Rubroshorea leprosula]